MAVYAHGVSTISTCIKKQSIWLRNKTNRWIKCYIYHNQMFCHRLRRLVCHFRSMMWTSLLLAAKKVLSILHVDMAISREYPMLLKVYLYLCSIHYLSYFRTLCTGIGCRLSSCSRQYRSVASISYIIVRLDCQTMEHKRDKSAAFVRKSQSLCDGCCMVADSSGRICMRRWSRKGALEIYFDRKVTILDQICFEKCSNTVIID
jgi:hypothetical protein